MDIFFVNQNNKYSNECTFYNNTISSDRCINLYGSIGTISKSNIILNNSPSYPVVFVTDSGNYILKKCILIKTKILYYILYQRVHYN